MRVLQLLAGADDGLTADDLAEKFGVAPQKAQYYLDGLMRNDHITDYKVSGEPTLYLLEARGRSLLVDKGLL
jgi:DNA-binding IclR family transcriptional regulator